MGQMNNIGPSHAVRRDDDAPCNIALGSRAYRAERVTRITSRGIAVEGLEMSRAEAVDLMCGPSPTLLSLPAVAVLVRVHRVTPSDDGTMSVTLHTTGRVEMVRGTQLAPIEIDGV